MNDTPSASPPSLATPKAIRDRHIALMQQSLDPAAPPSFVDEVIEFINQVADAGVVLEAPDERAAAQNILDYWNASLCAITKPKPEEAARTELEPFDESSRAHKVTPSENPFRDVRALGRGALLAGREDAIRDVLELIRQHPIVFVTGPPGSGRTSLVMAGVAPRLERSPTEPCQVFVLPSPGPDPLGALARVVRDEGADDLRRSPELFRDKVDEACGGKAALLIVENAGELVHYDQVSSEAFAKAIVSLALDPRRHSVILIVGDEWVESVFKLDALKPYATPEARYSLTPPTAAEIKRVLLALADNAGVRIESRVAEDLAHDLQGDIAALSLAQFMLLHLWERSKGGLIDWDAYKNLGRSNDALDRIAEQTYKNLAPDKQSVEPSAEQSAAKRMFLKLAKPEVGRKASSQRQSRRTLIDGDKDPVAMGKAIEAFEHEGLLRKGAPGTGAPSDVIDDDLEIIHDNLMLQWSRLDKWLKEAALNDQRLLQIRATADLWNKSRRSAGYLFNDDASIREARRYIDSTPESNVLRDFVEASDDALAKARTRERNRLRVTIGAIAAFSLTLLTLLGLIYYYHDKEQALINSNIDELKRLLASDATSSQDSVLSPEKQDKLLAIMNSIGFYQNFGGADVDLSKIKLKIKTDQLDLHDFTFHNLHVVDAAISGINFSSSKVLTRNLVNSAFSSSEISDSSFKQSNLSFSQFRKAKLQGVDFSEANLYHANFDHAQLCDVKFEGANLRHTTFFNTTIDGKTATSLQKSAWWLADEWTPANFRRLQEVASQQRPDVSKSRGFRSDRKRAEDHVVDALSSNDTFALAIALNDLAWTLTINGVDLASSAQRQVGKTTGPAQGEDCGARNEVPKTAQAAATQAVCLIDNASGNDKDAQKYQNYKSSLEDTLGYIYLQSGQKDDALVYLGKATHNGSKDAAKDALFRFAVAENAAGRTDDALTHMKISIGKGYVPTHERALLANYLGLNDFGAQLDQALGKDASPFGQALTGEDASPSVESEKMCTQ